MKHFISLAALLISVQITFAQTEKINLSDYKLPELKRHQLDFSFNSDGDASGYHQVYTHVTDTVWRSQQNYGGNGSLLYSFYRNSKKQQSNLNADIEAEGLFRKSTEEDIEISTYKSYEGRLSAYYDTKIFSNKNEWFMTGTPKLNLYYNNRSDKAWNSDLNESKYIYTTASVGIGGGKGRIEQVSDLRHAIYILSDLSDRGKLARNLDKNETIEFASLISELKNLRFFDSRKRKEADLVAIDSFLTSKGVITKNDISYFTGLEDMWEFGGRYVRESGNQLMITAEPFYLQNNTLNDDGDAKKDFSMKYNLSYQSKNPVSLKWQMDYDLGISHVATNHIQSADESTSENSFYSAVYLTGAVGFFPDTRTRLVISGNTSLSNISEDKILDDSGYKFGYQICGNAYYYISERFRLSASVSYRHDLGHIFNSEVTDSAGYGFHYNFTLSYAIF